MPTPDFTQDLKQVGTPLGLKFSSWDQSFTWSYQATAPFRLYYLSSIAKSKLPQISYR